MFHVYWMARHCSLTNHNSLQMLTTYAFHVNAAHLLWQIQGVGVGGD